MGAGYQGSDFAHRPSRARPSAQRVNSKASFKRCLPAYCRRRRKGKEKKKATRSFCVLILVQAVAICHLLPKQDRKSILHYSGSPRKKKLSNFFFKKGVGENICLGIGGGAGALTDDDLIVFFGRALLSYRKGKKRLQKEASWFNIPDNGCSADLLRQTHPAMGKIIKSPCTEA